jgi:hypothetical protein
LFSRKFGNLPAGCTRFRATKIATVFLVLSIYDCACALVHELLDLELFVVSGSANASTGMCVALSSVSVPIMRSGYAIWGSQSFVDRVRPLRLSIMSPFVDTVLELPPLSSRQLTVFCLWCLESGIKANANWTIKVIRSFVSSVFERNRASLRALLPLPCVAKTIASGTNTSVYPVRLVNRPLQRVKNLDLAGTAGSHTAANGWNQKRFVLGKVLVPGPTGRMRYEQVC